MLSTQKTTASEYDVSQWGHSHYQKNTEGINARAQEEVNAFIHNNYDVIDSQTTERGNIVNYYVSSVFDDQFYTVKRRKLLDVQ